MKSVGVVFIIACVLTLATWVLFAQLLPDASLDGQSTTAVLCAWLVVVTLVKLALGLFAGVKNKWKLILVLAGMALVCSGTAWFVANRSRPTFPAEVLRKTEPSVEVYSKRTESAAKVTVTRLSARGFLVGQDQEENGFGLYSYVLFTEPPSDATKERYLEAIGAYVRKLQTVQMLIDYKVDKARINVTYLPVAEAINGDSLKAEDVLKVYNYTRAKILLSNVGGTERTSGPYIVSTLKPLSEVLAATDHFLYLNLSAIPSDMVAAWVSEFIHQASQENYWEERTMPMFILKLRTDIEYAALAIPQVKSSAQDIQAFLSANTGWFKKGETGSDSTHR